VRQSIATHDSEMNRGWGVTGFDSEIGMCMRDAKLQYLSKLLHNL